MAIQRVSSAYVPTRAAGVNATRPRVTSPRIGTRNTWDTGWTIRPDQIRHARGKAYPRTPLTGAARRNALYGWA